MAKKEQLAAIKYTSREYETIKNDLVAYAKRYYPTTFQDFNEASFGALMLDTVAYVGDILSFYVDFQANECFLDTAVETNNIIKLGRQVGYEYTTAASSFGTCTVYVLVPANTNGIGVDENYLPILKKGTRFTSDNGIGFLLNEDIDFSKPQNKVIAAEFDTDDSKVTYYAVEAKGQAISGQIAVEYLTIGAHQKFLKVPLGGANIVEVLSVEDAEGRAYYEVDSLSQDTIYVPVTNRDSSTNQDVPSIMKPFAVPRRFTTVKEIDRTFLQFGFGSESDLTRERLRDPSEVILKIHGKEYVSEDYFDPSNLLTTDKFGVAPENTSLTVTFRINTTNSANLSAGALQNVVQPIFEFPAGYTSNATLDNTKVNKVINSLQVTNEEPFLGDSMTPTNEELRQRIKGTFSTQNRAVTLEDYKHMIYRMPRRFGSIYKCNLVQDLDSFKRNLNIYILAQNEFSQATQANSALKRNIKTWINKYKMINDSIDILDAEIVNIGIHFEVVSHFASNKYEVLELALATLKEKLRRPTRSYEIGEPFYITDVYSILNRVRGVSDVTNVKIVQKTSSEYSQTAFDIYEFTSADGRLITIPENAVFEIKFPNRDIIGSVK